MTDSEPGEYVREPDEATLEAQAKYLYRSVLGPDLAASTLNGWLFVSVVGRGRTPSFLLRKLREGNGQ